MFDENGWLVEPLEPLSVEAAYTLFAPEAASRIDAARWCDQASKLFGAALALTPAKQYPTGAWPLCDRVDVAVVADGCASRVRVITLPLARAPETRSAAFAVAEAMGGAGFDVLVGRGQRIWQVTSAPLEGNDTRASLIVAGVLAAVLLAPVLPPDASALFGIKGARERLAQTKGFFHRRGRGER
jgi:hypothetical protein